MDDSRRAHANRRVATRLAVVVLGMFGFGFALVPLYDVLCQVTGLNGKTGRIELEQALSDNVDTGRMVTVEFLGSVNSELPVITSYSIHYTKLYDAMSLHAREPVPADTITVFEAYL